MPKKQSKRGEVLQEFADRIVKLAKINIGATQTVTSPSTGRSYKKRIDNTGELRNSIDSEIIERDSKGRFVSAFVSFEMLDYGYYVDAGRRAGKGIPTAPLISWIRSKPLRMRDKDGQFVKMTEARVKSLAFLISRAAKTYGMKPTNFISEPLEDETPKFADEITEAIASDNLEYISLQFDAIDRKNANQPKRP